MPTLPLHQGCSASQAIAATPSSCSCGQYSSSGGALGVAGAADVDPDGDEAALGEVAVAVVAVPGRVVLAVGEVLEDDGKRPGAVRQEEVGGQRHAVGHRDRARCAPGGWGTGCRDSGRSDAGALATCFPPLPITATRSGRLLDTRSI